MAGAGPFVFTGSHVIYSAAWKRDTRIFWLQTRQPPHPSCLQSGLRGPDPENVLVNSPENILILFNHRPFASFLDVMDKKTLNLPIRVQVVPLFALVGSK